jgi:hypothetical protein
MELVIDVKNRMIEEDLSCYAYLKVGTYTSQYGGIRPLLQPINVDKDYFEEAVVFDRVIGKSAAFLLIYSKAKMIHAFIMSEHARNLLDEYHINYTYDELVPYIQNNTKTGMCPMEQSVLGIDDPFLALNALNHKVSELMKQKGL